MKATKQNRKEKGGKKKEKKEGPVRCPPGVLSWRLSWAASFFLNLQSPPVDAHIKVHTATGLGN